MYENLNDSTIKMALNMFLGLSTGHWTPTHLPTVEQPMLILHYAGKKRGGRPFKILNAAARPPKRYRPTIYWAMTETDLDEQTIKFYKLRKGVTTQDLITDFNECVRAAQEVIAHRDNVALKMRTRPIDPNIGIRRQARKLARELLGPDAHFSASRDNEQYKLSLENGSDHCGYYVATTEREAYLKAIATLASNCK